ncbi:MAG: hypothetical protein J0H80_10185, partial [Rhizobiales bacterium]|nr:hypothetical protein [Hyphomicrobiales bacterium]
DPCKTPQILNTIYNQYFEFFALRYRPIFRDVPAGILAALREFRHSREMGRHDDGRFGEGQQRA